MGWNAAVFYGEIKSNEGCRACAGGIDCALLRGTLRSGTWRSPVAHLNGVQGAAGSNPAVPIM